MAVPNPFEEPSRDADVHQPEVAPGVEDQGHAIVSPGETDIAADDPNVQHGAMRELATAFQANAEALRDLHEIHADLSSAIQRSERSEMMLQSTQALNETFRNLTLVQRQLLTHMETMARQTNRTPLVPLMILGLLVVLLGGVYLIVDLIQQSQPTVREFASLKAAAERGRLEAFQEGEARGTQASSLHIARLEGELEKADAHLRVAEDERDSAQDEMDRLERARRSLETERDELAERAIKSQNEAMARQLVEDELRELRAKLVVANERLTRAEEDYESKRIENEKLMKRLAGFGFGLPDEEEMFRVTRDRDRERASGDVDGDAPPSGFPPPAGVTTDPLANTPSRVETAVTGTEPSSSELDPWQPKERSTDAPPPPPPPPTANPDDLPEPALKRQVNLDRNERVGAQIRQRMNRLLDLSRRRLPQSWQVTKIGGFTREILGDVILLQYDEQDRKVGHIEAQELHIEYSAERKVVELFIKDGTRTVGTNQTPIPADGLRVVVGRGAEMVRLWRDSGLVMVKKR